MKLVIIFLVIVAVGCNTDTDTPPDPTMKPVQPEVAFLQAGDFEGETTSMSSELIGKLVIVNGCIRIDRLDDNTSYLPVWPSTFKLKPSYDKILIVNGEDEVMANVGDHLRLSGGVIPSLSQQLQANLPEDCPGPYWSVGNEITIIQK